MNDAVHILLAVALVALLLRSKKVDRYLVATAGVSFPMADHFLITPLIELGYLSGPIWVHRSITHSLVAGIIFVGILYLFGFWKSSLIGYSAHLVPDFFMGGVKLFLPFSAAVYGFHFPSFLNAVVGLFSGAVILGAIISRIYEVGFLS